MRDWSKETDEEIIRAMDEMDAAIPQTGGLHVAIAGCFSPGTPHHEYWRRSLRAVKFNPRRESVGDGR